MEFKLLSDRWHYGGNVAVKNHRGLWLWWLQRFFFLTDELFNRNELVTSCPSHKQAVCSCFTGITRPLISVVTGQKIATSFHVHLIHFHFKQKYCSLITARAAHHQPALCGFDQEVKAERDKTDIEAKYNTEKKRKNTSQGSESAESR